MIENESQETKENLIMLLHDAVAMCEISKDILCRIEKLPGEIKDELLINQKIKVDLLNSID